MWNFILVENKFSKIFISFFKQEKEKRRNVKDIKKLKLIN